MTHPNSITKAKADNLRAIIAALREREMPLGDIADLLGFGPSGVRKYTDTLLDMRAMVIDRYIDKTPRTKGHPIYRLGKPCDVDGFLAYLDAYTQTPSQFTTREKPAAKPIGHEPMMAAFFGLRGAA